MIVVDSFFKQKVLKLTVEWTSMFLKNILLCHITWKY